MGHRTTRPQGALRACHIRSYVAALAVLAWLAGAPVLAQTGTAQVDRVIDGDTISVRLDGVRYTVRLTGVDTPETTHRHEASNPTAPKRPRTPPPDSRAPPCDSSATRPATITTAMVGFSGT